MHGAAPAQQAALGGLLEAVGALERELDAFFEQLPRLSSGLSAPGVREAPRPWPLPQDQDAVAGSAVTGLQQESLDEASVASAPSAPLCVVLDDDPAARMGLSLLLEGWGLEVCAFQGLAQLRAWLNAGVQRAPRMVIADHHFPQAGEGLVAIALLRAAWPQQVLPALLLTGDHGLQEPGSGVQLMFKPASAPRLRQWVRESCGAEAQLGE